MTRLALATPRIARIARIPYAQIRAAVKGGRLYLATTNPLLAAGYRGTVGLKTGYTVAAGRCLIAVVRRGRRTLGVVLLGSPNPGEQAKRLIAQIRETGAAGAAMDQMVADLARAIEDHVKDERDELFPKARSAPGLDLAALGIQLKERQFQLVREAASSVVKSPRR